MVSITLVTRISCAELQNTGSSGSLFYTGFGVGAAVNLLELGNIAILNAFWPFFLEIISLLLVGMLHN